jgi:hypothetical protein
MFVILTALLFFIIQIGTPKNIMYEFYNYPKELCNLSLIKGLTFVL